MHAVRVQQDANGRTQYFTVSLKAPQIQHNSHSSLLPSPFFPLPMPLNFVYTCPFPIFSSNTFLLPSSPSSCPLFYKTLSKPPRQSLGLSPVLSTQTVLGKTCLTFTFSNCSVMSSIPLDNLSSRNSVFILEASTLTLTHWEVLNKQLIFNSFQHTSRF